MPFLPVPTRSLLAAFAAWSAVAFALVVLPAPLAAQDAPTARPVPLAADTSARVLGDSTALNVAVLPDGRYGVPELLLLDYERCADEADAAAALVASYRVAVRRDDELVQSLRDLLDARRAQLAIADQATEVCRRELATTDELRRLEAKEAAGKRWRWALRAGGVGFVAGVVAALLLGR